MEKMRAFDFSSFNLEEAWYKLKEYGEQEEIRVTKFAHKNPTKECDCEVCKK